MLWNDMGMQTRGCASTKMIFRFRSNRDFYRLASKCTSGFRSKLLPSINGFRLSEGPHSSYLQRYQQLFEWERDRRVRLQFTESSPVLRRSAQHITSEMLWGIENLHIKKVWRYTTGRNVRLAVVDTGIDEMHSDLQHALQGGVNILDAKQSIRDDNGHGTHIAGTIAANGKYGLVGVAPDTTLYAVKAFDQHGTAYISDIVKAIEWCVAQQMNIINMSFGMRERSDALHDAVVHAQKNGVVVVASAGNGGQRAEVDAPARYTSAISVGAINRNGQIASFSKRSPEVEMYAPGEQILSAWPGGSYKYLNGSSMAAAHVSGVTALMMSVRPTLDLQAIRRILRSDMRDKTINASESLRALVADFN
jgi:subtilisin family serine protease